MNIFSLKTKKYNILFVTFLASITLFSLKKINFQSDLINYSIRNSLRFLLNNDDTLIRCEKAKKSLKDLYKEKAYVPKKEENKQDEYQQVLIDLIKTKKIDLVKDYIKRLISPLIILGLGVIAIFFWIGFCGCSCYPCGCCNGKLGTCGKVSFTLTIFFNSIILVMSLAFIILFSSYLLQSINSPVCALYKFTFHFLEGTKDDYTKLKTWHSLDNINSYIIDIKEVIDGIDSLKNEENGEGNCDDLCKKVEASINKLKQNKDQFNGLKEGVQGVEDNIKDLFVTINDMKENYLDNINKIFVDYIDKYYKLGLDGFFALIGVLSFLGLIALISSITCNCICARVFYHLIWNLQIIIALVLILLASCFNIIGIIGKDSIAVLQYVKSKENIIESDNPLIIKIINLLKKI